MSIGSSAAVVYGNVPLGDAARTTALQQAFLCGLRRPPWCRLCTMHPEQAYAQIHVLQTAGQVTVSNLADRDQNDEKASCCQPQSKEAADTYYSDTREDGKEGHPFMACKQRK